jgi:hypothetical protein
LNVLYGETATMMVSSNNGRGTRVTIRVPVLVPLEAEGSPATFAARSTAANQPPR